MALLQELDTGTPIRVGAAEVTLTIDGQTVRVPQGTSVMAAATLLNAPIPRLCATDSLEAFGSCRLCLGRDRGTQGHAGVVLHHPGRSGNGRPYADAAAQPSCGVA